MGPFFDVLGVIRGLPFTDATLEKHELAYQLVISWISFGWYPRFPDNIPRVIKGMSLLMLKPKSASNEGTVPLSRAKSSKNISQQQEKYGGSTPSRYPRPQSAAALCAWVGLIVEVIAEI